MDKHIATTYTIKTGVVLIEHIPADKVITTLENTVTQLQELINTLKKDGVNTFQIKNHPRIIIDILN